MSTSLLYHGFGLRGIEYCKTTYPRGEVHFFVVRKHPRFAAPAVVPGGWFAREKYSAGFVAIFLVSKRSFSSCPYSVFYVLIAGRCGRCVCPLLIRNGAILGRLPGMRLPFLDI